ncbi:MAG: glycerophosphodiester phosphodiesterase family protein [Erythrobacter sp.]|jgi:glycerophosphoryl diester phosphodiesterase|nr:glycerophosphodiester phosphodiesterase family protein [Erythrobacter sp.]
MNTFQVWMTAIAALGGTIGTQAQTPERGGQWHLAPDSGLSAMLDCHEAAGLTLISAHRGGPSPGLPENSIAAMDAVLTAVPAVMEVDVARSPDGVHYLMHDRTVDRTTTGSGAVTDLAWSAVAELQLVDEAGWVTPYRVPTLRAALEWAKGRTILQLDFKRTADFAEVIAVVQETQMADSVILIAYSEDQARRLHELAPDMLISYSLDAPGELDAAVAAGIPANRIVAFTGTRLPRPDLYSALDERDVEVIFGTLGRSPRSIDNTIARLGTDERYAELGEEGVDILATDRPREAALALAEAERLPRAGTCGVSRAP